MVVPPSPHQVLNETCRVFNQDKAVNIVTRRCARERVGAFLGEPLVASVKVTVGDGKPYAQLRLTKLGHAVRRVLLAAGV